MSEGAARIVANKFTWVNNKYVVVTRKGSIKVGGRESCKVD